MNNASGAQCDRSYWQEVGGTVSALRWFYPSYVQGHGTLRILVAVDSELARVTTPIGPDQESHIFSARLGRQRTIGADACAGCADDASLYFAQADFFQTNLDNFVIDGVGFANWPVDGPKCVSWQQGAHPSGYRCLMIVDPTHNATWGSIKSLYR